MPKNKFSKLFSIGRTNDYLSHTIDEWNIKLDKAIAEQVQENSHSANILLTLFNDKRHCDVILVAGLDQTEILAHRCVLTAASSNYFDTIFKADVANDPNQRQSINFEGFNGVTLNAFLNYWYTGHIAIDGNNIREIITAASHLEQLTIEMKCVEFLRQQLELDPMNCLKIYSIAGDKQLFRHIKCQALHDACENFEIISKTDEFMHLNWETLSKILESNEVACDEKEILDTTMRWLDYDCDNRRSMLPALLKRIRFVQFDLTYLIDHVKEICMTYDCSKLFTDTLQWFSVPERRDELTAYHLNSAPRVSNRVLLAIGYHSEDIIALEYFCPNKSDWTVIKEFQYKYFFSRQTMYFNDYLWIFDNAPKKVNLKTLQTIKLTKIASNYVTRAVCIINEQIYSVKDIPVISVESYNFRTEKWQLIKQVPVNEPMLIISSVVMEDCLYTYAITKPQHIINRYDPLTNRWDWYPLKQDYNAIHVCMTTLNGLIYLIGNEKCCTFDPESQKIEMIAPLEGMRCKNIISSSKGFIVIGVNSNDTVMQEYDYRKNEWTAAIETSMKGINNKCLTWIPKSMLETLNASASMETTE